MGKFKLIKRIFKDLGEDHLPADVLIGELAKKGLTEERARRLLREAGGKVILRQYSYYKGRSCLGYSLLTKELREAVEGGWEEAERWLMKKALVEEEE